MSDDTKPAAVTAPDAVTATPSEHDFRAEISAYLSGRTALYSTLADINNTKFAAVDPVILDGLRDKVAHSMYVSSMGEQEQKINPDEVHGAMLALGSCNLASGYNNVLVARNSFDERITHARLMHTHHANQELADILTRTGRNYAEAGAKPSLAAPVTALQRAADRAQKTANQALDRARYFDDVSSAVALLTQQES